MTNNPQLTYQLYKWLVNLDILSNNQKYKSSGNFGLDSRTQQQLLSGFLIGKLLVTLAQERRVTVNGPLLSSIKNSNTPAARIYNWNILSDSFQKLGIHLTKQNQKQITAGDFDTLLQFIRQIYNKTAVKVQRSSISPNNFEKGFDLKNIASFQEIKKSQSLLQFIVISLSNYLSLTPKQAVSTLSQSAKYLAHMIVKGVKGSFDQIIQLFLFFQMEMSHIVFLSEKDPQKNYELLLQIIKPTLISREPDLTKEGCSTLQAFIEESLKYNSKNMVYQILCRQEEAFDFVYMGIKRHPYLNSQIWDFMYLLVSQSLGDFFEIQFKKTINNEQEYLRTFLILLEPMLEHKQTRRILLQLNIISKWQKKLQSLINSKLKSKEQTAINEQTKLLYIQILSEMWISFYDDMDKQQLEEILLKLVQQLKKNTRLEIYTIKIPSLYRIFGFLQFLASNKNKLAAIIYKKIIFLFVQNHQSEEIRQIILENFILILQKFPTIPLQFLLQPLLKQVTIKEGTTYVLNIFDFDFMLEVCKHPKMQEFFAVDFFTFFSKLYVKSIIFSPMVLRIIEAIGSRFCESDSLRQQMVNYTDSSLNLYGMLVFGKIKATTSKGYPVEKNRKKEQTILNNQKKSLIIQILKFFIKLQHRDLTNQIRKRVAYLYVTWYEHKNYEDKGLASILRMFGELQDVCLQYKVQAQEEQEIQNSGKTKQKDNTSSNENSKIYQQNRNSPILSNDPFEFSRKNEEFMENYGIGYKKKKNSNSIQKRTLKPDPRVLEDIEKIKEKWKLENSRAKLEVQELKKEKHKLNEKELLQRNISLGYNKLPNFSEDKILFDFDTVKTKHLKIAQDFIELQQEEDREKQSMENIMQRYNKYLKLLFRKYAYASASGSKSGVIGNNVLMNQEIILSFTQIMRMLKDKGLSQKVPKIAINEILAAINHKKRKQRNVLGGIYERDFPTFLVYFTDLYLQNEKAHQKDEPFGMKVEQMILRLMQDEKGARQLFDPKIQKLKESLQKDQSTQIPQGYRKIDEVQINLVYSVDDESGIGQSYGACVEVVDWLMEKALGIHAIAPITDYIEKKNIVIIPKVPKIKFSHQMTQKNIKRPITGEQGQQKKQNDHSEFHESKPAKKSSMQKYLDTRKKSRSQKMVKSQNKTQLSVQKEKQEQDKEKKRQRHAQKLKQQIERLKEEKYKKQEEQQEKERQEEAKKKLKEDLRQKYLQENKKKIEGNKKRQEEQKLKSEAKQKEEKERKKNEIKNKQAQLLQKQKKAIQDRFEKLQKKKKDEDERKKQRQKLEKVKISSETIKKNKDLVEDDRIREIQIKNSIKNGQLKDVISQYNRQLQELFEGYWEWKKQKIDIKGVANVLKDFNISPQYVHPKTIPQVYKNVSKGQMIDLNGFTEVLTKLAYKSQKVAEQVLNKKQQQQEMRKEESENSKKLNKNILIHFFGLLKMKEQLNYKQVLKRQKTQQLG